MVAVQLPTGRQSFVTTVRLCRGEVDSVSLVIVADAFDSDPCFLRLFDHCLIRPILARASEVVNPIEYAPCQVFVNLLLNASYLLSFSKISMPNGNDFFLPSFSSSRFA